MFADLFVVFQKRKLEGEEEEEVKRQKIENQTENASESDKAPYTQQDEGAESDETGKSVSVNK